MSSLKEIESAVIQLSPEELRVFRNWFAEHDAQLWDSQFEDDVAQGRLDTFAEEAIKDVRESRSTDL